MSQKQQKHNEQYHYVNTMGELPEDERVIPSNVTPIEELGICLVDDEEAKTLDSDEEGDEVTPAELKVQFFTLITELQRKFPEYTATDFKKYLEEEMTEQLQILQDNFHESFKDVDKTDPEFINLLIGLSSIGIEIPKDEVDEGDDELQQIEELKIDEPETDV